MGCKAKLFIALLIMALVFSLTFVVLSNIWADQTAPGSVTTGQAQSAQNLKTFTKDELKQFNGQNGHPAYVAVDGIVYDVTNVPAWKGGKHKGYKAGADLTAAIKNSPHGVKVLKGLTIVGKYIDK